MYRSLSLLLNICKPGKPCRYGVYHISTPLTRAVVPRDVLDEHTVVLYSVAPKLVNRTPYTLAFTVVKDVPSHPFEAVLPNIENCRPGVCIDGLNVPLGDWKSYIYTSYAMYLRDLDTVYSGVILSYSPIEVPGGPRWLKKLRLRLHLRRLRKAEEKRRKVEKGGG